MRLPTSRTSRRSLGLAVAVALTTVLLSACGALVGVGPAPTTGDGATPGAALDASRAQTIAARVVGDAVKAGAATGAAATSLLKATYTGHALDIATADARLASVTSAATRAARTLTSDPPTVLSLSRGTAYPRSMVVQATLQASGLPVLYLLTTPDVRTPYRIAASSPMLPGARIPGFDTLSAGSPALGTSLGGPTTALTSLGSAYAASLAYPAPATPASSPFTAGDAFATAIKGNAAKQAAGVKGIGSFRQVHELDAVSGGMRTADGGTLAFALLDREDTFVIAQGQLTITPSFTALSGLKSVTAEADLSTYEVVVFVVPVSGPAVVVGADEHLYAARGI